MSAGYVVGVDLGGTKIHAGISGPDGDLLAETRVATHGDLAGRILEVEHALVREVGVPLSAVEVTAVGGAGAAEDDGFDLHPNLDLPTGASFGPDLARHLGHPVVLENDVNVAALGELHHGVGTRHDSFVVVASGTGIGMGVVVDRRLVRGARGAAGEIGFLPLGTDPFDPAHHRRGPLEEAVAGDVLAARVPPRAHDGRSWTTTEIFDAVATDPAAAHAVAEHAHWLALALVAVRAVLDPEVVVLTGGIGSRAELLPPLRRTLDELGAADLAVRASTLGPQAPVLGAIHLARAHAPGPALEGTR
ncbi:ROK family protein [Klenkia brasiliensis]|uniref:Sugar kinase of the NBD/HSP70 family, may contain an N-terminal HTH domain n=1 Tax=Klenkia brasiliensis TaxID=333142 RepID=A0A1G7PUX5_9ACTN|nr:ROK family protein [Klenkia brasiliensis]SDF90013.1 Sugar kinase of the NBD/HSP70 family, may contain an N-terminal HTH domain [Klenkia brasiliensis]